MKLALSSTSLRSHTPRQQVEAAARIGYDAIEVWAEQLWDSDENPDSIGRYARKLGLEISLHGPSRDLNVTSSNRGIRHESRTQYKKSLEDAARMNAKIVNLHPGSLSSTQDNPTKYIDGMAEYAAELGEEARRMGLVIGLEIMERRRGEYLTDIPSGARIAREVNNPALGITVDLAHLLHSSVPVDVEGNESTIVHVHISGSTDEKVHVPLADGKFELKEALLPLVSFFRGIVTVEGYVKEKEIESALENKRTFDRLLKEINESTPSR